ncbi:DNA-binding protein [Streptomyces sp. NPDC093252]|uniref:helix-turn-helix domain-containing protein n=1 Tax=Streptomyces sp. NPDC093252 TaxID=3154980 RepID=UPI003429D1B9
MAVLLTTGQAAAELDCAITTLRRLIRADVLPGLSHRGVRVMIPLDVVQALRQRPHAPLHHLDTREIAVLRVDAARPADEDDHAWTGYAPHLGADRLLASLRGWWRCDPTSIATAGLLPVTLSGYIVAVLTGLDTWQRNDQGRHAFPDARLAGYITDLATPTMELTSTRQDDRALAALLLGTRLPSHSGGPIAYVTPDTTAG